MYLSYTSADQTGRLQMVKDRLSSNKAIKRGPREHWSSSAQIHETEAKPPFTPLKRLGHS